jgi:two-component system, response regulator PdtaR
VVTNGSAPWGTVTERHVNVLLVEDDILVRAVIADELRDSGIIVFEASQAEDALELLAVQPIDLTLTDIKMPGKMNGLDLVEVIHAQYPHVKVAVMSGYAPPGVGSLPVDAFFRKPFDLSAATATIKRLLER